MWIQQLNMGRFCYFPFWGGMHLLPSVIEGFRDASFLLQNLFCVRRQKLVSIISCRIIAQQDCDGRERVKQGIKWCGQYEHRSHHIWLGTVKSEEEPETAYDSAPNQIFPWTNVVVKEPNFQSQYSQEAVALEMTRGGSCQPISQGLHGDNYGNNESGICGLNLSAMQKRGDLSCKLLFRKMLTPSDAGRLNRIVIPKKNATMCFPEISRRMEGDAKAGVRAEVQVDFFDRTMKAWKFRYCYWKSSQSYVFTRGWSRFVKDKNLKVNDVVAFYLCEVRREGKLVKKFLMIDPDVRVGEEDSGGSSSRSSVIEVNDDHIKVELTQPEMLTSVFEGSSSYHHPDDVEIKRLGKQVMNSESPTSVESKGFRLFGVQIN
ncbi:hypothetical protein K1719_011570 [Acacia pycnantha]|nr:hypothetical protein K1719_011570 [Acacia pycnantha]